ncbi:MAG TPA: GlxA family transcriptional regulator [Thermoanaerobaculia bacterium]|nr:GlxA family transcriptional regulator [Thermoanaerobaculia bacterium]
MRVVILAPPMSEVLDITGPYEVFAAANGYASQPLYEIELYSTTTEPRVRTTCGLEIPAAGTYRDVRGAIDTLLIAGGAAPELRQASNDSELLGFVLRASAAARRVGSICTGAFILAASGLLSGKRATTHWSRCDELARRYPDVHVERDSIYTSDANCYTSAGVTAGIDLALALVEEDAGANVAASVARDLVLYVRRPAGQPQLSTALTLQFADRRALRDLQSWMVENLRADLSVSALADRCAMSPRHFARVFLRETGATPARFVERLRVESASRRLEESADTIEQVSASCGFGSADSMRRVFVRLLGHTPSELRTGRKRALG